MDVTLSDFFEFNPFDNKISSAFLHCLPESTKSENGKIDRTKEFWRLFYFDNSDSLTGTTEELIKHIKKSNTHFILFKGPSGSGKTTYLKRVIEKKEDYFKGFEIVPFFDIVNLIEYPYKAETGPSLLLYVLRKKIIEIIQPALVKDIYSSIAQSQDSLPIEINNTTLLEDLYSNFVDILGKCNELHSKREMTVEISRFLKLVTNVSDMIALYIIFNIFNNCLKERRGIHYKPAVFIFDNLDELEFKYLARNLSDDIHDSFSKAQGFFEILKDTSTPAGEYEFLSHCTLIESVREGFVADINKCQFANQQGERIDSRSFSINFNINYQNSTYNIAEKRFALYRQYMQSVGKKLPGNWFDNGKLLVEEKQYVEELSDLFNKDYRVTLCYLAEALTKDIQEWEEIAKNDRDCILGIRSFLLFYILKSLYKKDTAFKKYVSAELKDNSCNKNRMFMSLLTNVHKDNKQEIGDNSSYEEDDNEDIELGEYTRRIKYWYKKTPAKTIYETVFVSNNNNYSILASLEGELIDKYFCDDENSVSLLELCSYLDFLFNNNPDELNDVKIIVNPVCSAYTQTVFINFEYFNLVSIAKLADDEKMIGAKSLFQYNSFEDVELCLKRVFDVTKKIVRKADKYVCDNCACCNSSIENKEEMCNLQVRKLNNDRFLIRKNTLYKTRVITSHINYLDSFRKMMWIKYHNEDHEANALINDIVLVYINKYINLFYDRDGVLNKAAESAIQGIKENYEKAKSTSCEEWVPISIGLRNPNTRT